MENRKIKILAIDDNNDNLISLKALINEAFPESITVTAIDGKRGLELAATEDPDVILLDVIMPGMDGFEVCHNLKTDSRLIDIPVVFITALKGDRENRIRALESGAEAFISKPIDESELTAQIRAMVKIKSANLIKHNEKERLAALVEEQTHELKKTQLATLNLLEDLRTENEARKKSEAALLESEEKYRGLVEGSPDAIAIYVDDKIVFANRSSVALMRASNVEELIGRSVFEFVHPKFQKFVSTRMTEVTQSDKSIPVVEERFIRLDGSEVEVEVKAIPVVYNRKNAVQLIVRDITERKRAEEAISNERTLLRTIIDLIPDAIYVKGSDGRKILANLKEVALSGKNSEDEVIGKTDEELFPDREERNFEEEDQLVLESGKSIIDIEGKLLDKNGHLRWLLGSKVPLRNVQGEIIGIVGLNHDITERKHTEEELLKLSRAVEQSPTAVIITNPKGDIEYVNNKFCEVTGYSKEEAIGQNPRVLKSGHQDQDFYKKLWATILSGKEWKGEFRNKKKNGELYWESALISPLVNKDEEITHFVAVKEDVTEKRKMIEELITAKEKAEEMNRLKSNFLANMSHELRTPLNGILGYSEVLVSQLDSPVQTEMAEGIYQSGKRLSETLNFILDLSEAETNSIEVIAKDIAVVPLAKNSISLCSNDATKKNLQMETIIKDENILAHLDEHLFGRIIYSLIDNAIKFTDSGKISIEIGTEINSEQDWMYIKIKDTGIGIPENKINLIWDEFRQVSEGLNRSYEGAGLGLTISKKAVELMHGVITVESELGVGSIFTVKFPRVTVIPKKDELIIGIQPKIIPQEKGTILQKELPLVLCVEDDFVNRNIVKLFLKNICVVETAEDGETAIQLATEKKYDLFLMDINLGGGKNGMEVVSEILKNEKYAGTPIVAVTAYAMGSDKAEFLEGGCTHYLPKPFHKSDIIDLVTTLLNNN
jgi:PAS domain S-box-containing protein